MGLLCRQGGRFVGTRHEREVRSCLLGMRGLPGEETAAMNSAALAGDHHFNAAVGQVAGDAGGAGHTGAVFDDRLA